ncbi:MAG: DNA polymerase III subunit beta [Phycisphaerae bacterium]|nr:DNA polymerase III subunit beta [Phycisphaerae bacterium]
MKVICNRNALADALSLLATVVSTRTTRPILQCLRLQTDDDGLTLLATDLELGLKCHIKEVEVEEHGQTVAPAAKLSAIVHQIEEQTVTLSLEEEHLAVTAPGAKFRLYTFDPDEYPPVAPRGDGQTFSATAGLMTTISQETIYAAAKETSRYAINGLHMEVKENKIVMVGTDGRRLARAAGILPAKAESEIACIIPGKAVAMIERLGPDPDVPLEVTVTENQVAFSTPQTLLISNLVEGRFPNYEAVIPRDNTTKVKVERNRLLSAVRRAALMTSKESHSIKMTVEPKLMTIEAKVPEQGEAVVELPVEGEGEPVTIAFNPEYLTDPLRVIGQDEIVLEFKSSTTPALLKAGPDFLYVLMPVTTS